jgi:hypothetical protein
LVLTHIALFKLKDRSSENTRATRDRIAAIEGKIPQLLTMQLGINEIASPRAYDIALIQTFESVEAMQAYQVHPVHKALLADVMHLYEAIATVDYEN